MTFSNTSCAPNDLARSIPVISDIGSRGALYLRAFAMVAEESFQPNGRWAIIPTKPIITLCNVRSAITQLPKSDGRCHNPGSHRLARSIFAAANHLTNCWSTLVLLLSLDCRCNGHRSSLYMAATSAFQFASCSSRGALTTKLMAWFLRSCLYLAAN